MISIGPLNIVSVEWTFFHAKKRAASAPEVDSLRKGQFI
jgi:hypothetical protein